MLPSLDWAGLGKSRAGLALLTLVASGCVVSFEGYELASSSGGSAGAGASGGSITGGTGGAVAGSGGTGTGGTGGTGGSIPTGGTGGTGGSIPTGGTGGSIPTGGTGGTGGTVPTGGTGGGFACPTVAGASGMVKITDGATPYCIDSTEVTMKQYAAFLGITNKPPQSAECTSNSDYTPSSCGVTFNPGLDKPVVCVDWCDARAYCNAIGKRLCGKIGGGPLAAPADAANAAVSQWYRACSAAGTQDYPYGPAYAAKTCNGGESDFIGLQTVPVVACVSSAYPLLYDMSGNAAEWEDDCDASGCAVRGGHHLSLGADLKCAAAPLAARTSVAKERGFRCCFD